MMTETEKIQDRAPCGAAMADRGSAACNTHASMEGQSIMTDDPVELDEHRGMAAQKLTEIRRRLNECHALAAPSTTWVEAAAKARYLILLFAETSEARNPRRQELIAKVLDDLARLSD